MKQCLIILGAYANRYGQYQRAIKYFSKACLNHKQQLEDSKDLTVFEKEEHIYEMQKKLFENDDHPFLIETLINLASFYSTRNENENKKKSIKYGQMAIDMHMRKYNRKADHPGLVRLFIHMAQCYSNMNMHLDAIEAKRRALDMQRIIFSGRVHPEIGVTLRSLSVSYSKLSEANSNEVNYFTRTIYGDYFARTALHALSVRTNNNKDTFISSLSDMERENVKIRHEYELNQMERKTRKRVKFCIENTFWK